MANSPSPVQEKSYAFALQSIMLHRELVQRNEYVLGKQLLHSATSIGANVEEARAAQSRRDFLAKMSIASKEARESHYWLRLLRDSSTLPAARLDPLIADCATLVRLLTKIVKTTRAASSQPKPRAVNAKTRNSKFETQNSKLKTQHCS